MSISTRTRFEVLKRDEFRCAYCGTAAEAADLHVDHIVPTSRGGTDEITNLITACSSCNLGKSNKLLDESSAPTVSTSVVVDLEDRLTRSVRYAEAVVREREELAERVMDVMRAWAVAYHAVDRDGYLYLSEGEQYPEERSVRSFLGRLPLDRVLSMVDHTAVKFPYAGLTACRYFYGACWRLIKTEDAKHRLDVVEAQLEAVTQERDELRLAIRELDAELADLHQALVDRGHAIRTDEVRVPSMVRIADIIAKGQAS